MELHCSSVRTEQLYSNRVWVFLLLLLFGVGVKVKTATWRLRTHQVNRRLHSFAHSQRWTPQTWKYPTSRPGFSLGKGLLCPSVAFPRASACTNRHPPKLWLLRFQNLQKTMSLNHLFSSQVSRGTSLHPECGPQNPAAIPAVWLWAGDEAVPTVHGSTAGNIS